MDKVYNSKDTTKENKTRKIFKNVGKTLLMAGTIAAFKGRIPSISRRGAFSNLSKLLPYKIELGAEAIVINNSPTTVTKIIDMAKKEMLSRNKIPNTAPVTFIGYVKDKSNKFLHFFSRK